MINDGFLARLTDDLREARHAGQLRKAIRMSKEQAKLIEGEYAVQHSPAGMSVANVPIVIDDSVPFGSYRLD